MLEGLKLEIKLFSHVDGFAQLHSPSYDGCPIVTEVSELIVLDA